MQAMKQKIEKIDLELLPEEAKRELLDFYEFLVEKYVKSKKSLKKEVFFESVRKHTFILPEKYNFNREEIHER